MTPPEPVSYRLGTKLRTLRTQRGLTVRAFAAQIGFSPSFISQLEADLVSPSIASLEKISTALGVTLGQLFSSLERTVTPRMIVRAGERITYTSNWSNTTVTVLSDSAPGRTLSAMELIIEPGGLSSRHPEARPHDTLALLQSGTLLIVFERHEEHMAQGDTAYILAGASCSWVNRSETPAVLLLLSANGRIELPRGAATDPGDADQGLLE